MSWKTAMGNSLSDQIASRPSLFTEPGRFRTVRAGEKALLSLAVPRGSSKRGTGPGNDTPARCASNGALNLPRLAEAGQSSVSPGPVEMPLDHRETSTRAQRKAKPQSIVIKGRANRSLRLFNRACRMAIGRPG